MKRDLWCLVVFRVSRGDLFNLSVIAMPFYLYAAVAAGNLLLYRRFFGGAESPESAVRSTA